jgi:hypothetical protein
MKTWGKLAIWPLFTMPATSVGWVPLITVWTTTMSPSEGITSITSTRKSGLREGAPDGVNAASYRRDPPAAIGNVPSSRAPCTKSYHTFNIMSVIGGEEGSDRFEVFHFAPLCWRCCHC